MTKPTLDRVISWQNITKNMLKWTQHKLGKHATLMSYKWDYTTHTRCMQNKIKPSMDSAKAGPRSHTKNGLN